MAKVNVLFSGTVESCRLSVLKKGNSSKQIVAVATVQDSGPSIEVREEWQVPNGDPKMAYHLENLLAKAKSDRFSTVQKAVPHLRTLINLAKAKLAPNYQA